MSNTNQKMKTEDIAYIVESEGLDYAILHYLDADAIEDGALAKLWKQAGHLLEQIEEMLEEVE